MNYKRTLILVLIILMVYSCSELVKPEMGGEKYEIQPPVTEMLNIPSPNMTDPAEQLYASVLDIGWNGVSDNSIIKGYHYQITTEYMESHEIFVQDTVFTTKDKELIVFPSKESVNKQTVSVFAEDKDGRIDPDGDQLVIYTRQSVPPETEIVFPAWGDTLLVNNYTDYIWQGIKVVVADSQPNPNLYANPPEVMDYLYKIDDGEWSSPMPDSAFFIVPSDVPGSLEGPHTIYVKARNTAFKDDDSPAAIDVFFYVPNHDDLEWLVIDDTYDDRFGVSDAMQDDYFNQVFGNVANSYGMWDYATQGVVSVQEIARYKNVLYHCEHTRASHLNEFIPVFWQYVETGGNLMITSKEVLDNLERPDIVEELKYFGDFTKEILHIENHYDDVPNKLQAVTFNGSDTAAVDFGKISAAIGGVTDVTYVNGLGNFCESVFKFATADSSNLNWNGRTVGSGYYNDIYRVIFCGFPLYPFTVEGGEAILRETIKYFEEDKPF